MSEEAVIGRPTTYTPELASKLCDRLIEGMSVRAACADDDMPAPSTVFLWLQRHKDFSEQYARALEARTDAMADDIMSIADDGTNDWMERKAEGGEHVAWVLNGEALQRSRLRVDARKWLMSKMAPKKYGDKIVQEVGGIDGKPIETVTKIELVAPVVNGNGQA